MPITDSKYKPEFPYLGNQVIISSGRVVLHSYDDYIFHFGKKGVSISTPGNYTMDVGQKTIISCNTIELGFDAKEPLLLGRSTTVQLGFLLDGIGNLCDALSKLSATNLEAAIPQLVKESIVIREQVKTIKNQLVTNCLSKTTFTK